MLDRHRLFLHWDEWRIHESSLEKTGRAAYTGALSRRQGRALNRPGRHPGGYQERSMLARYRMFAGYNAWCNERLFDASARVSDADYRANRGVFFKSLHGTLNHLLVGDRIWMRRFTGDGEIPARLDEILYDNFDQLRAARRNEDEHIRSYISALSEADLAKTIRYRTVVNARYRTAARPGARSFFQSPNAPSRPGACTSKRHYGQRSDAQLRPDYLSA
jgi:uncharacterized damage-inducible protein DinB